MAHPLRSDPYVAREIDEAVATYADGLSFEELEWMRDQLACLMAANAPLADALDGAHPRPDVDRSGERVRLGLEPDADAGERDVG